MVAFVVFVLVCQYILSQEIGL